MDMNLSKPWKIVVILCDSEGKESACQCKRPGLKSWSEDPMETEMATHHNILAYRLLWTEEPCRL